MGWGPGQWVYATSDGTFLLVYHQYLRCAWGGRNDLMPIQYGTRTGTFGEEVGL